MHPRRSATAAAVRTEPSREPATDDAHRYTAELETQLGYLLRRAQLAVFADFSASQPGPVTRPGQFSVLFVIGRHPGLSQTQLCDALGIKRANLVAVLDQFESLGLARRESSADDRRANRLYLTAAGEKALEQAVDAQREHEARLTRLLGASGRRDLIALLAGLCALGSG
jgi:DNA-binding MarR family transcriptional regulator